MIDISRADLLVIRRVSPCDWVVHNDEYPADDSRRLLACVHENDGELEVLWMQNIPLPTSYVDTKDVLSDLTHWLNPRRNTRPIPIAAFPPRRKSGPRSA